MLSERTSIKGSLVVITYDAHGKLKSREEIANLITQIGDQFYGERAAGIGGAPAQITGMKLGTSSTAPAKTGSGAALGAYLSASQHALDGGFPASSLNGSSRRITYQTTYAPGEATTVSAINEVVLVNDTLTDATSATSATIARALITTVPSKASGDTLIVVWRHDLLGA